MTESEAKNVLDNIWDFTMPEDDDKGDVIEMAVSVAAAALEEIRQYREFKEIFENQFSNDVIKLLSDKEEFAKWLERGRGIAKKCDELGRKVECFESIGTVSEFRELKEKAEQIESLLRCHDNFDLSTSQKNYELVKAVRRILGIDWSEGKE